MYVFYDTETTGLNGEFSQILQIALAFADDDFNLLSSKDLRCRRLPWVVPSPGAMLTTGLTPDDLEKQDMSHYEMMREALDWLKSKHWPVVFIGYNTLGFDEPVLASALNQTLNDPFVTTSARDAGSASSRADLLNIVKAVAVYAPDALKLDIKNKKGFPSLQLGHVCRQNGITLSEDEAHDAFNDVKATIALARLLKKAAPDIWAQMMSLTSARAVDQFISQNQAFVLTVNPFGEPLSYISSAVTSNGVSTVVFDLSHDPETLFGKTSAELAAMLAAKGDARFSQPLQVFDATRQPVLMPLAVADSVRPDGLSDAQIMERQRKISGNGEFCARVAEALETVMAASKSPEYIEQQVEPSPAKIKEWMDAFHAAPDWSARGDMIEAFRETFADDLARDASLIRYQKFARRLLFTEAEALLQENELQGFARAIHQRITNADRDAPYMTIPKARRELEDIEKARAKGEERWKGVTDGQIRSLKLYYTQMEKEFAVMAGLGRPELHEEPEAGETPVPKTLLPPKP